MPKRHDRQSCSVFARAAKVFPGGVNSPVRSFKAVGLTPFVVARAEGPYLFDVDDNRYTDFVGSWGPLVLGHAHPAVVEALGEQARRGTSYGACCEQELALAEAIQELMPSIEMLRFVNSGTEAGMSVIRLARAHTGRTKIVKFTGGYHGHADALLVQAGSGAATFGVPSSAGVPPDAVQDTLTAPYNDSGATAELFKRFPDQIAAVIVEPAAGNAGLILPEANFLRELRNLTAMHGSLLIFDEVMTGFRVHLSGAQALFGVTPDLTMLGKVIGGGLPVGAYGGKKAIMERVAPLGPVYQAGTLSGNPLAMAAGRATLREWTRPGVFEQAAANAAKLVTAFQQAAARYGVPLSACSLGTMFCVFFRESLPRSYEEAQECRLELFNQYFGLALDHRLFFPPSQFEACFISAAHSGAALEETLRTLPTLFAALAVNA